MMHRFVSRLFPLLTKLGEWRQQHRMHQRNHNHVEEEEDEI